MIVKTDHKKELKHLYRPASKPHILEVPAFNYLMVDGQGDPGKAPEYQAALEALYSVAYPLKFMCKKELGQDYVVMPLEGLWWAEDMDAFLNNARRDEWQWTMMILQPDIVTTEMVDRAIEQARDKKNPAGLDKLRFEVYEEGLVVQTFYTGSYTDEGPTIAAMHEYAHQAGHSLRGKHHEIYLNDPRRTAPEKLKTVLRQQIK